MVSYRAAAATLGNRMQQKATWNCRWVRDPDSAPRLALVRTVDFEEIEATGGSLLSDCTEAVLGENESFREYLMFGLNHWANRVERLNAMYLYIRYGLSVGDANGDGLDDVYVCQPGGLPNRLYLQQPDGTAVDRSAWAGVDWLDKTTSALFADLDNDGDQDLALAVIKGLFLLANDGTGRYSPRGKLPLLDLDLQGISAADYDQDGDLDLYVTVELGPRPKGSESDTPAFVYHDANDGGANVLFRNDIAGSTNEVWMFADVTEELGLGHNNRRHSLAASWEDYDDDGDPDLYVANDYGQNCLYRNQYSSHGNFTDVAREAGVVDFGSGMSTSWGDFDRDGLMDLYVGNMFSSAGSRITSQLQFLPYADASTKSIYHRFAKGNSLFRNAGNGTFEEVGAAAGVERARWAWSSLFTDLNNDGWEDVVVANGYITNEDTEDL